MLSYKEDDKYVLDRHSSLLIKFFENGFDDKPIPYIKQVVDSIVFEATSPLGKLLANRTITNDKLPDQKVSYAIIRSNIDSSLCAEGNVIWVNIFYSTSDSTRFYVHQSFKYRRYKLRLLVDLNGTDASELWGAIVESATKSQIKVASVISNGSLSNPLIAGYVPIFHWDKKHDSFLNTCIDYINIGIAIPFKVSSSIAEAGWGLGMGLLTNQDNKSAIQIGVLFPNSDFIDHNVGYVGIDIPVAIEFLSNLLKK